MLLSVYGAIFAQGAKPQAGTIPSSDAIYLPFIANVVPATIPTVLPANCYASYPDFCIPSPPPELACRDIPQKNFTVLQPDPHRLDGNKNGIGCEE
ncbi:MAG: hypothetical protein NT075_28340 [Chloroflexi bacterium]|nr:hypothetical protein [Chloroflexota bacterium]